jgi:hypothetical protein
MARKAGAADREVSRGAELISTMISPDVSKRLIDQDAKAGRNLIDSLP